MCLLNFRSRIIYIFGVFCFFLSSSMTSFHDFDSFDPDSIKRRPFNIPKTEETVLVRRLKKYLKKHSNSLHEKILLLSEDPLVFEILDAMDVKEFDKAEALYLKLSIGDKAWPIGGINLGIVQQSERKVANNDTERLTNESVTELKRLINLEKQ